MFIYYFNEGRCSTMWSYLHLDDSGGMFYCWCPDKYCLVWYTACCKIASQCVGEGEANLRCVCVIAVEWNVCVCRPGCINLLFLEYVIPLRFLSFLSNKESLAICYKVTSDRLSCWWLTFQMSLSVRFCLFVLQFI